MPFLLRVVAVLGAFFGTVGTVAGLAALVRLVSTGSPPAPVDDVVSNADFLAIAVRFLLLYLAACLTAGAASRSLWKQRPQARALLAALLVELVVGDAAMLVLASRVSDVSAAELGISAGVFVTLAALALWYLFGKRSVVQYFASLARLTSEATPPLDG